MTALVAANVTVTVTLRKVICGGSSLIRKNYGTIAFGDGALTYPTGGIPLPSANSFGFVRVMDSLKITGVNGKTSDYLPSWDKTNGKLQLWASHDTAGATTAPMDEQDTSEAPAARSYTFEAEGW